ncbi:uncharacterized protein B0I36DRAFT_322019, partial [Microdochium trichocladiopsis]
MTSKLAQVRLPSIQDMVPESHLVTSGHMGQYSLVHGHRVSEENNTTPGSWASSQPQATDGLSAYYSQLWLADPTGPLLASGPYTVLATYYLVLPMCGAGSHLHYPSLVPLPPVEMPDLVRPALAQLPELQGSQTHHEPETTISSWNAAQSPSSMYQETLYCSPGPAYSGAPNAVLQSPEARLCEDLSSGTSTQLHDEHSMAIAGTETTVGSSLLNINGGNRLLYPSPGELVNKHVPKHDRKQVKRRQRGSAGSKKARNRGVNAQKAICDSCERESGSGQGVSSHTRQTGCEAESS